MSTPSFHKRALQMEIDSASTPCPNVTMLVTEGGSVYWMPKAGNVFLMDIFPAYFGSGYIKNNVDLALPYKVEDFQKIIDKLV